MSELRTGRAIDRVCHGCATYHVHYDSFITIPEINVVTVTIFARAQIFTSIMFY